MVLQMSEMDKKISDAFTNPTPEHVEGDVLSVGEMATDDVFDWLKTELSAIDIRYRGDPSYDHDAYWFRDRVENLFDDARKAFPEISSAQSSIQRAERDRDEARENATALKGLLDYCEDSIAKLERKWQFQMDRAATAEAQLADAVKVLEPFAAHDWADEHGWNDHACRNDRICDWFGPSDFRAARAFLSTIGEKPDAE